MTLPDPSRGPPQLPPPIDSLPPAPQQWSGNPDDAMRNWLRAKEEEDRRKQEEEKTHQEELKLEQRRIEQNMLRESLASGIPPHLVPVIFAGLAGGPLAHLGLDLVQQHLAQLQQPIQHPPPPQQTFAPPIPSSPDARRDGRAPPPPAQFTSTQPQGAPAAPLPPGVQQGTVYPSPAYQSPAAKALYAPPTHAQYSVPPPVTRNPAQAALPHLTTNEVAPQSTSSFSQQQEQPSPSPSIYFHYWHPPNNSNTNSEKKTSPNVPQHVSGEEMRNSPRKRKAIGPHQAAPPPRPTSPAPSSTSSGSKESRHLHRQSDDYRRAYDPIGESRQHHRGDSKPTSLGSQQAATPPRHKGH
ncbi:hypothetical protein FH972_023175 [Carpinus fangiana]|uniref:Uncharacterized protein n=1 Tax=Carpinus fangiana TaxID=176857 RepID=A0A5N6KUU6_9ROSI|nr:hypothetical protein FH972_023175 [Carpinus fangiana]